MVTTNPWLSGKGGILEKLGLQASAPSRRGIRFEGLKFAMGDFILSCAQATGLGGGKQLLGVVLEVEYLPLLNLTVANPALDVSSLNHFPTVCSYVVSHIVDWFAICFLEASSFTRIAALFHDDLMKGSRSELWSNRPRLACLQLH